MSEKIQNLIANALSGEKDATFFVMSQNLAAGFPNKVVRETESKNYKLLEFAWAKQCEIEPYKGVHSQIEYVHNEAERRIGRYIANAWHRVKWQGAELISVTLSQQAMGCKSFHHYVVGDTEDVVRNFMLACCEWNSEIRGEVLVFSGGWFKDEQLFSDIRSTTLETLVLEPGLKEEIVNDVRLFFSSKESFKNYGVPWKRGVLLLGSPGNGKTHAIKGLVNALGVPCLYVRTFKRQYKTDQEMIREVFKKARSTAPCLLIFEDLDSMLDDGNRSYFLNELDGFGANEGIFVIATTNHPERLDPAILDRPSRFDRKYMFRLPDPETRAAYLQLQNQKLGPELRLSPDEIQVIAGLTNDFSFAYLKELVLSSMMKWISKPGAEPMIQVMKGQLDSLKYQMQTPAAGLRIPRPK